MKIAFYALNQNFCGSIIEELQSHHTLKIYKPMKNDPMNWANIIGLLNWCDLAFFEFCQTPLPEVTQLQVVEKPIIARMDGIDILNFDSIDWRKVDALILMPVQEKRLGKLWEEWHKTHPNYKLFPLPKRILRRNIGIDLDTYQPDYQKKPGNLIGFHSQVMRDTKGVYIVLECFHALVNRDPDKPWRMHMMGQWEGGYQWPERMEYVMSLRELLDDLKLGDRLTITPHNSPPPEWSRMARELDLMWCYSFREGFPNSVGEAAASGVYPLINHWYGAELLYPSKYLIRNPLELVEKTIEWGRLSTEEKIQGRREIRAHIEQYDRHRTAVEIRELCEEVLEAHKK